MRFQSSFLVCLALSLIFAGCQKRNTSPNEVEPTAVYDWMAGESPVPHQRSGMFRAGLNNGSIATGSNGIYAVLAEDVGNDSYIMYADNSSDTFIKLCGRPDCTHTSPDCNAYIYNGSNPSFYNGYLYVISGDGAFTEESKLIRMDSDGSNHVVLLDFHEFAKKHDGDFVYCNLMTQGYCLFSTYGWKDTSEGYRTEAWLQYYIYKLDGSMKEPQAVDGSGMALYSCGDVLLTVLNRSMYDWNLETDTVTYLAEHPNVPGYFDSEAGYYFKDGAICRLNYDTETEDILLDTGLNDDYYLFAFSDSLVVASRGLQGTTDNHLYVYNWEFQLVDTVEIQYPHSCGTEHLLVAETVDRYILSDEPLGSPKYYIEKDELGTGNAVVHSFKQVG